LLYFLAPVQLSQRTTDGKACEGTEHFFKHSIVFPLTSAAWNWPFSDDPDWKHYFL